MNLLKSLLDKHANSPDKINRIYESAKSAISRVQNTLGVECIVKDHKVSVRSNFPALEVDLLAQIQFDSCFAKEIVQNDVELLYS